MGSGGSPKDRVAEPPAGPSRKELFSTFFILSATGFGGVLSIAHRMIVERRRWLNDEEFVEVLGLCQFVPGGNIINMAVVLGSRFRGVSGAFAALAGLLAAPTAIAVVLGGIYARFVDLPWAAHAFAGLSAAAVGLLGALAIRIAWPLRRAPMAACFAALSFGAVALFRVPLAIVVLCLTPICILCLDRGSR